jgi:peptide/nickel transport system substrate-binding protein
LCEKSRAREYNRASLLPRRIREVPTTSPARFTATLLAGAALALVVIVPGSAQTHASPKQGGTLVVGLGQGDPDALDPSLSHSFSALEVYRTICERLYDTDSKSQLVPQLAAALPAISKNKLKYTIPIRKGVSFNDGTPLNAAAVVTSLERMVTLPGSSRASDLEPVASFATRGPYTVVIHLKAPFTPLPQKLSSAGFVMSPTQLAKLGDNFATDPVCVGPFMYDNRIAGDSVTVIRSPYYYDRKDVHLDRIVFKVATDGPAAAAALKAGDLDVLDSISTTELPGILKTSSLRVIQANGLGWAGVVVNIGNKNGAGFPPYTNTGTPLASSAGLRKAFEEAIDRHTLARVVFGGGVQPGCTPVSPADEAWYDASVACTPYDPNDARKLVAASGETNPTVDLLTADSTDQVRLAQFIQAEEAAVGIKVVVDVADATTALTRANSGDFDAFLNNWSGAADPDTNIYQFVASSGTRNFSGYSNPRLDLILENGRKATTTKARATLYRVAQQIMLADRPIIFLYNPIKYAGVSANVTGVQLFANVIVRVAFAQFK